MSICDWIAKNTYVTEEDLLRRLRDVSFVSQIGRIKWTLLESGLLTEVSIGPRRLYTLSTTSVTIRRLGPKGAILGL